MVWLSRPPSPALMPFVDLMWYADEPLPLGLERKVPTGRMQIVVNLADDELRWYEGDRLDRSMATGGSGLCGPAIRPVGIDTAEQQRTIGVSFRPGGTVPFFAAPAEAVTDPVVDLADLWGRPGSELRDRLLEERSPAAMLRSIECALLARAVNPLRAERGIEAAVSALGRGLSVRAAVEHVGTTSSTLSRAFRRAIGLPPKSFARVLRLQRVLEAAVRPRDLAAEADWSGLAATHGYFDQSHLINEFRALIGTTPTAYRPRSPAERNHLPIAG
jgi:AraC-like DNA-binding protein